MARRGEALREHILWSAKGVFLELGFERASMDLVAARAETSKRSLYAHFENKEALFFAVIELVRDLFASRLGVPGDQGEAPAEAIASFCARYLGALFYERNVRMSRLCMAEAERFPEGSRRYFDVVFEEARRRLAAYLETALKLAPEAASEATERLLADVLHPRLPRVLFGIEPPRLQADPLTPDETAELAAIRAAVDRLLASS